MDKKNILGFDLRQIVVMFIIGIITYAFWDYVISDAFKWIGNLFLELAVYVSEGFRDRLYERVSDGPVYLLLRLPMTVFIGVILGITFAMVLSLLPSSPKKDKDNSTDKQEKIKKNKFNYIFSILLIVLTGSIWFVIYQSIYTTSVARYLEKSIDILAPHTGSVVAVELRAQYRSIKEAKDFDGLYERLLQMEEAYGVKLPEFDTII